MDAALEKCSTVIGLFSCKLVMLLYLLYYANLPQIYNLLKDIGFLRVKWPTISGAGRKRVI